MSIRIAGVELHSLDDFRGLFPKETRPSRETLRRYVAAGRIPARKLGRTWWISESQLRAYFESVGVKPVVQEDGQKLPFRTYQSRSGRRS
jgi:excisionase family DNA binding protein